MKKLFTLVLAFACALFAGVSCTTDTTVGDTPIPTIPVVTVNGLVINSPAAGNCELVYSVDQEQDGVDLQVAVEDGVEWLTAAVVDAKVFLTYTENLEDKSREALVYLSYGAAETVNVTVKQVGQTYLELVTELPVEALNPAGGELALAYVMHTEKEAVLKAEVSAEWLKVGEPTAESVTISYEGNESGAAREGVITLSFEGAEPVEIKVNQEPFIPKLVVTGAPEANLAPEAGSFELGYVMKTLHPMTDVLTVEVLPADGWLKVGELAEATIPFTYDANLDIPGTPAREATITLSFEGAEPVVLTVKQNTAPTSFAVEFLNVTPQMAQYVCTPNDSEGLYLLASSQDLGQYGVQGETPVELMQNYVNMLASYGMLTGEADNWFVFKGATTEMPKDASRWSAEESVTVYAVGINVTIGEVDPETGMPAITTEMTTAVNAWAVPFLPYPSLTIAEADLNKTVAAAAGEVVIDCAIENPVEGTELLVETEATWVTASYADGKLTLAYEANTAAVARRAKIAVSYGYFTNPTEITLVQEKDANAQVITLNIEVTGTQFNGIIVNVTPSDENVTYALNQCAVEKDYETGAELPMDWMGKAEELLSYTGTTTFHKGALTNHFIKMNPSNYEWYGYDYYVYAVPVAATSEGDSWTVSQILGEVAYTKTTVDASKMPSLAWDLTKTEGLVWNENNERYDLEVVEGSTVVLHFVVNNPVEGAFVTLNGTSLYDSYNVVDGEPVVDNAAGTITLKIDKFDTEKNYHYVQPTFKYTNADGDTWGITTPSLRLTQVQAQETPETPAPENPAPENPAPENPAPENPAPENPAPENPAPENPAPENPTPGEGTEPGTGENPAPENPENVPSTPDLL